MRVMVLVKATESSERGFFPDAWTAAMLEDMGKFNDELRRANVLLHAEGLKPSSHGTRIAFHGTDRAVINGPFAQTRELVAGYWLWQVKDMAEAMKNGDVVAVFPEGTTSDGRDLFPFHANLIQSAIQAQAPVQPMALQFVDTNTGAITLAPCYIGEDTLLGSMWRTLKAPGITAVVHIGALQHADGRDRRTWAHDLREEVIRLRDTSNGRLPN